MAQIHVQKKRTAKDILALHDVQCCWAILILFFFLFTSYENFDHTMASANLETMKVQDLQQHHHTHDLTNTVGLSSVLKK